MTRKRTRRTETKPAEGKRKRLVSLSQNVIIEDRVRAGRFSAKESVNGLPGNVSRVYSRVLAQADALNAIMSAKDCQFYQWGAGYAGAERSVHKTRLKLARYMNTSKSTPSTKRSTPRVRKTRQPPPVEVKELKEPKEPAVAPVITAKPPEEPKKPQELQKEIQKTPEKCVEASEVVVDLCKANEERPSIRREHTVIDKLLLGIQTQRQWTEKGLQVSGLPESQLGLLTKRAASIECNLSGLQESRDENNNTFISVLLQCALFKPYLVSADSPVINSKPSSSASLLNFHKSSSNHHSFYRNTNRNTLPSILSKPSPQLVHKSSTDRMYSTGNIAKLKSQLKQQNTETKVAPKSTSSPIAAVISASEALPHSTPSLVTIHQSLPAITTPSQVVTSINQVNSMPPAQAAPSKPANHPTEPLPTASQLLKLKNKAAALQKIKDNNVNLQNGANQVTTATTHLIMAPASSIVTSFSKNPHTILYKSSPMIHQNHQGNSIIIPANTATKLIPISTSQPTLVSGAVINPGNKTTATIMKPTIFCKLPSTSSITTTSTNRNGAPANGSQSVILKNLLQQDSRGLTKVVRNTPPTITTLLPSSLTNSTNHHMSTSAMMTYSAFQQSRSSVTLVPPPSSPTVYLASSSQPSGPATANMTHYHNSQRFVRKI